MPISDKLIAMRNLNTYINWKPFDFEGNNSSIQSKSIKEMQKNRCDYQSLSNTEMIPATIIPVMYTVICLLVIPR